MLPLPCPVRGNGLMHDDLLALVRGCYGAVRIRDLGLTRTQRRHLAALVEAGDLAAHEHGVISIPGTDRALVLARIHGGLLTCQAAMSHYGLPVAQGREQVHLVVPGRGRFAALGREVLHADRNQSQPSPTSFPVQSLPEALARFLRCHARDDSPLIALDAALHDERVTAEQVRALLREELVAMVDPSMDRRLAATRRDGRPAVTLVVGVNGVGKTTTVGKLARVLVAEDRDVVLGAADTFRAAAAEQLATWGARVGVPTVRSEKEGADPASVAFEAVAEGIRAEADVVLVDTAGRLQNKSNLMDELGKIKRVIEKQAEVDEVLLVLDATTGQNGLTQAKVFAEVVDVTGIVLTKLDGTAKGGIVIAIQRQLGVPVKLIGLGEGPDDLAPFTAEGFVDALLAD